MDIRKKIEFQHPFEDKNWQLIWEMNNIGQQQLRFKSGHLHHPSHTWDPHKREWVPPVGPSLIRYYTRAFYDTDTKTWYHTASTNKKYYPEGMAKRVSDGMFLNLLRYGFVGYNGRKLSGELK